MWTPCGHTHKERASGNGCLQCNPEKAHDIARRLVKEMEEKKEKEK